MKYYLNARSQKEKKTGKVKRDAIEKRNFWFRADSRGAPVLRISIPVVGCNWLPNVCEISNWFRYQHVCFEFQMENGN